MKRLGWSAYLNKKHMTALVLKELKFEDIDFNVASKVRESNYVNASEAFKMGVDDARPRAPREDIQRTDHTNGYRQQVNGHIFSQGAKGGHVVGSRLQSKSQPAPAWHARQTIHSKRQNGLVVETPAVGVEESEDARAAAEGISPRRRHKVMPNEDVGRAAQRSPRHQEQSPQANGQGGHMHDMKSSNGHVRSVVAGFEQPRNLAQSPRRQQGSGPPLASRNAGMRPMQSGQVPTSSPREDPCTLSVAQKAATIEARAASQPCRQQPVQPQPQGLHRIPTQQGIALRQSQNATNGAQGRVSSAPGGYPVNPQHHYMPSSRSTIPMAQGAGRSMVPALGGAPQRPVQQGAAAPQGFVVNAFSSRGRSSSPAGITAGQPTTMGYIHHPGPVQQRR